MVAEKRLVMTAYTAMHQARTYRPISTWTMTRKFIMYLSPLREQEPLYHAPTLIEKLLKDTTMSKWLEALND